MPRFPIRIGLIVPVSNTNLEPDMAMLRPAGVSIHTARVGGYDLDAIPDAVQMRRLAEAGSDAAVDSLSAARVHTILYGCTSATLASGPEFDRQFCAKMAARAGVPAVTAAGAVVEALQYLQAKRIAFASPYTRALNADTHAYLRECGVKIIASVEADDVHGALDNYGQGALTPEEVFDLGRHAAADAGADADALLLSCTDMRAAEAVVALEEATGLPVVCSNTALLFAAVVRLRESGFAVAPPAGFGRLLDGLIARPSATLPSPRPEIRDLPAYPSAKRPAAATAAAPIYLDQNENAVAPSPAVVAAYKEAGAASNRYADGHCIALREAIAAAYNLPAAQIICGNGSMELIALLVSAYCARGDEILCPQYAYLYFDSAAQIAGAKAIRVPVYTDGGADDFTPDVDALIAAVTPRTKILCLDNPNNPTGAMLTGDAIVALRDALRDDVLLLLDAAYAEYATADDYRAGDALVARGNVVMLRTFSKIYGLAGARVGWGYFPPAVADVLNRMRLPNNVSAASQAAAVAALAEQSRVADLRAQNAALRRRFIEAVNSMPGLHAYPSQGSYVLVRFASAAAATDAFHRLCTAGIFVRPMNGYGLADCLRVTVGTEEEMRRVVEEIVVILER